MIQYETMVNSDENEILINLERCKNTDWINNEIIIFKIIQKNKVVNTHINFILK